MNILKLLSSFFISFSAAGLGNLATADSVNGWYATIDKPFYTPPNWLFGPVWTVLYILIALSLYWVWVTPNAHKKRAYYWFGVQLVLNAMWSLVFFGAQQPWLAMLVILLLIAAVWRTMTSFKPIDKKSYYALVPYLAWISFAALLNLGVAVLN